MSQGLKIALSVSLSLHVGMFWGLPTDRATFDVERAPTSIEVYVLAKAPAALTLPPEPQVVEPEPQPRPHVQEVVEPLPESLISPERKGVEFDRMPSYLRNPPPVYPRISRERGEEGRVVLRVEVLLSGKSGEIQIISSSGHPLLDEAAVKAIRTWQFRPATRLGYPVDSWVELPVKFTLIPERTEVS